MNIYIHTPIEFILNKTGIGLSVHFPAIIHSVKVELFSFISFISLMFRNHLQWDAIVVGFAILQ